MRYAVYRCLYGEDFVQASINSVAGHVDKIFVFWTDKPWGGATGCVYKGEHVEFPDKFDSIIEKVEELDSPKITLVKAHTDTPWNQLTYFTNNILLREYDRPDTIVFPEIDHVFREDQVVGAFDEFDRGGLRCAMTRQVELWRTPEYRIPERPHRHGVAFWDMMGIDEMPTTGGNAEIPGMVRTNHFVHNFGFAVSEKVMYWKHMTALGFSRVLHDSEPNEAWYDKWLSWRIDHNNENLEISKGSEGSIPYAVPYDVSELPELIREMYGL